MKKLAMTLTLAIALGLFAAPAFACPWNGHYGDGPGMGRWGGDYRDQGPAPSGDYQKFMNETADLRKELAARGAEYDALMVSPNPDPTRAGKLSKEIFELRRQLQEKAREHEISGMRHRNAGYHGHHHRGGGSCGAYCW